MSYQDRPLNWKMDYSTLHNVTSYDNVLLTPESKPVQRGMPKVLIELWDEENERRKGWKGQYTSINTDKVNDFFTQQLIKDEQR